MNDPILIPLFLSSDSNQLFVTSDHGDMMAEHGMHNKGKPYQSSAGVPFIIRFPGQIKKSKVIETAYTSPDFAPTILSLMGIDHSDIVFHGIDGSDEIFNNKQWSLKEQVRFINGWNWIVAVKHHYKLVLAKYDVPWLFDLKEDPNEMINYSTDPNYSWIMDQLQIELLNATKLYKLSFSNSQDIIFYDQPACHDVKDQIPYLPYRVCNNLRTKKYKDKCDLEEVREYCPTTCGICCKDSTGVVNQNGKLITCDDINIQQWRCTYPRISMFCPLACSECGSSMPPSRSNPPNETNIFHQ